jgi:tetratricopeptide (TPR) repeat protein
MLLKQRPVTWRNLWPLAPMFVVGFLAAMHTAHLERVNVGAAGPEFDYGLIERSLIASRAMLFYVWKLLIPHPLIFVYPRWTIDVTATWQYVPVVVVLAVAAASVVSFMRGHRGAAIGLAYFAGTAFPALGFFNVFPHRYSFVADHFIYLASIGVIATAVASAARLLRQHRRWRVALVAAVLAVFGTLTWLEGPKYANAESLWRTTIDQNPNAWLARTNLANILLRRAEQLIVGGHDDAAQPLITEAEKHGHTAVALAPLVPHAYSTLAEALRLQGRYQEALDTQLQPLRVAHERVGDVPPERLPQIMGRDYFVLGRLYHLLDRNEEAASAYRMSLQIRPVEAVVWRSLGQVLVRLERYGEARDVFQRLVELTPNDFAAQGSLAALAERTGDRAAAERAYTRALPLAQDAGERIQIMTRMIRLLTEPLATESDVERATRLAEQLLTMTGGANPAALDVLASVHARAGRIEEAIRTAEQAAERARSMGQSEVAAQIESRLDEYRSQQRDVERRSNEPKRENQP